MSRGAVTGRVANMRYLIIGLLITLAACAPYTYDANRNPIPYRGSASAMSGGSENCGTPDEPKRCPRLSTAPSQASLGPSPGLQLRGSQFPLSLLVTLLALAGCQPHRPDFMTRVRQDCAGGDKWACDLLDSLGARSLTAPA